MLKWVRKKRIFLDYAAGTPVSKAALRAYMRASVCFANPQGLHTEALVARAVLDKARKQVAHVLQVTANEIVFTSGGTESNNLAITGYMRALQKRRPDQSYNIVVSAIDHSSVLDTCKALADEGVEVRVVAPDTHGVIRPEAVRALLNGHTALVSVGLINGEIGTVQPIHAIAKVVREHNEACAHGEWRTVVHTDASQAPLYVAVAPHGLGVDMMTFDAGKMYGPKGSGVLYVKHGVSVANIMYGGGQEGGRRSGTEAVALYAGCAQALLDACKNRISTHQRVAKLHSFALQEIRQHIPHAVVNGTAKHQSPHIVNISIPDVDAEYLAMYLDRRGVAVSTKSACLEMTHAQESPVVRALVADDDIWRARSALRISFGAGTTRRDIRRFVAILAEGVARVATFPRIT